MNMLEPPMSLAPMLRAWLDASTRWFDRGSPSSRTFAEATPPNAPDGSILASEDWDLLFRAVLDRLQRVVDDWAAGECVQDPGEVLRECVAALNQLGTPRASVSKR
jgi:hypothetical protein